MVGLALHHGQQVTGHFGDGVREFKQIALAFVYGSIAKGGDKAASDIDLMIVSDSLTLEDAFKALAAAETQLGRTVNPSLYTTAEFRRRRASGNAFVTKVLGGEKILLIGSEDAVA